jgi:hypothetical protein
MKTIIEDSYENLSEKAAGILLAAMLQDKRVNISITVGICGKSSTPSWRQNNTPYHPTRLTAGGASRLNDGFSE